MKIMNKKIIFSVFCLFIFLVSSAQELANVSGNQPVISPKIGENDVTFSIMAPYAASVKLSGAWMVAPANSIDMVKAKTGLWSVTIPTPKPELYTYSFVVDGLTVRDPNNIFQQRDGTRYLSVLLIPGEMTANYFEANQRGNLSKVWYESPTLGLTRRMYVYTPYGYDGGKGKYPVLYLLHGAGGDEDAWSTMGRACQIMDNLIEKKLATPMIVVMTNGNATQTAAQNDVPLVRSQGGNAISTSGKFEESIVKDVVPYIDKNYRTYTDRNHRAITGLSMGGAHATLAGLNNIDKFAWVGSFSGAFVLWPNARDPKGGQNINLDAVGKTVFPNLNSSANSKLKLLYISCGNDDFLFQANRQFKDWLKEKKIKFVDVETPGYAHVWSYWRISLIDFTGRLFK
jgi:enterochelin esterase-like enzyme